MNLHDIPESIRRVLRRRGSYRRVFTGPDAEAVLIDLAAFCNAHRSTVRISPALRTIDPLALALGEGRREVFMRISANLHLSDADLLAMAERVGAES